MGQLFDRFDIAPIEGENITIEDCGFELFISETDSVFYYPGCVCTMKIVEENLRLCIHTICAENIVRMRLLQKK